MKYLVSVAVCLLCVVALVNGQPAVYKLAINKQGALPLKRSNIKLITPVQAGILFEGYQLNQDDVPQWLQQRMEMRSDTDMLKKERPVVSASRNIEVNSFFQYYKGIKVEHGVVNISSRNRQVTSMQLEFYSIPGNFSTRPSLTEAAAFQKAAASMQLPDTAYPQQPQQPAGELVIVRTYDNDSTVCLAWKFKITNAAKFAAAHVYVDAQTGRIVLQDNLIKHSNTPGQGDTRYSGRQTIITDNSNPDTTRPYRLRQQRNGYDIVTFNYQQKLWDPVKNDTAAVDFADNDNSWDAIEHYNAQQDDAALDVQFNMQVISDYWKQVHNRNSWNNGNAPLRSFVHVNTTCGSTAIPLDNAFWYQSAMYFGDGSYGVSSSSSCFQRFRVLTPLDVTAHEVGHGVTEATCRLLYRWESGALNEALSDIWGTVIEQWGIEQYASISAGKKRWVIGEEMTNVAGQGIRDMQNPRNFNQPSTYKDNYWTTAAYPGCIPTQANDYCGVHQNSGVLNKWFYLITMGESSTNYFNQPYNVTGMGFLKSRELMYLTTLNLTPNAGYSTAKAVTLDAASTLFGAGSAEVETVLSAWRAVGVDSAIWDMSNTPEFATANTQSFLSIGIGKNNTIWAGTDKRGLFVFDGSVWTKRSEISNVRINDIKGDKNGGIWVAQSGTTNSGMATAGGVNYFADPDAPMTGFYTVSTQTNVPTRNVRSIHIDKTRLNNGNPRVWIAANTYINSSGNSTSGKLAVGFNSGSPNFTGINQGIEISNNTGGVTAVGGGKDTIWTFAPLNFGKNQLIAYHAGTNALIAAFDNSTDPAIPANINVRAIYTDARKRTWFGLATNAVLVYDQYNVWHYVSFPAVFIAGSQVNSNAITGSPYGDVYIGTTAGLVFFDKTGPVNSASSYQLYKKQNGLPSSNITGIAYDKDNFKVWLASDQGICRWDPLCLGLSCNESTGYAVKATSAASGNWSDAATWLDGIVPDSTMEVFIDHTITVDVNASCNSLTVLPGGATIVSPGSNLVIYGKKERVIQTGERSYE